MTQLIVGGGVFYFGFIKDMQAIPIALSLFGIVMGWIGYVVSDRVLHKTTS